MLPRSATHPRIPLCIPRNTMRWPYRASHATMCNDTVYTSCSMHHGMWHSESDFVKVSSQGHSQPTAHGSVRYKPGKRDSIHHHFLEAISETACARIETKASIHQPLWVVVVYKIGFPKAHVRPVRLLRVSMSEGLTQANS